jgi:hypothetical protein
LDVFTYANGYLGAYASDILAAIQWVITNKDTRNICAINLSLGGGGPFSSFCADDAMAVGVTEARKAGILSAVAAGNSGWSNGLSAPACSPAAVSVGATYDAALGSLSWGEPSPCSDANTAVDKIACFSNSSPYLSLLAPGSIITAGGLALSGTSQAAPHVAGASQGGAWAPGLWGLGYARRGFGVWGLGSGVWGLELQPCTRAAASAVSSQSGRSCKQPSLQPCMCLESLHPTSPLKPDL